MSQEIQLSLTQPGPAVPQTNSWSGPAPSSLGPVQPQQNAPFAVVHQHLRGRYFFTAVVAGIFALVGGAAGFKLFNAGYQSVGLIEIDPVIRSPDMFDKIMPMYTQYVQTVVATIHSERVMREAMQSPEWKAHRKGPPEAYLADWNKNLVVKPVSGAYVITITYTDEHKDGKEVAPIVVAAVIDAYKNLYGDTIKADTERKIDVWKRRSVVLAQESKRNRELIDSLLQNVGENPQFVYEQKLREHLVLEQHVRDLDEALRSDRAELQQAEAQAGTTPYAVEDFARVDPAMQEMYKIHSQLEMEVQELETRLGMAHPAAKAARERLSIRTQAMNKYRDELRTKYFIKWLPNSASGTLVARDLSLKESGLKRTQDLYNSEAQFLDDLGRRAHQVTDLRSYTAKYEDELAKDQKKIEELATQEEMAETFKIIDRGSVATIGADKRIAFGALGVMAGGGIPVALLLLASLMNPRFRFSDEAIGETTNGMTLLGILPDLPDRLSDPEQASIAAHCVHQIRTMLQINTGGMDERRVFAVTSAAPGDGKTSLTLALGLSYAACGTRTLLIDCDLIGAGLTARMNVAAADGVLEAISHRSLLEYVRSTDIADVSILPVGSGQHLHASTLSPAALRRLIEEAKKHFDTILIDTGPVLGSIEASLVAAAADAVVLTVSRGQQRPLVEKTIQHLKHIKANLAGVVFNRAQTSDFDRSISGLSLRSAAAGSGHNASRIGPVARAVQSAFKPAGETLEN